MVIPYLRTILVTLLATVLCGCSWLSSLYDSAFGKEEERVDVTQFARWSDGKPRLRPGVAVIVNVGVAGRQSSKFEALVDQNGDITMPLLLQEPIACDGLTLEALKQKLVKAYSVYYRQPQVSVTFAPYDGKGVSPWGTITVLGEVVSPGPVNIPSTMALPVTKALQMAGGLKPFANRSAICVTRCDKDGRQTRTYVDLKEIGKDGRVDKDMSLRAGDVVWVPETWY